MPILKAFWGIIINFDLYLQLGMIVALILILIKRRKWGQRLLAGCLIPFLVINLTPMGECLLEYLEDYTPRLEKVESDVSGFIFLGGTFDMPVSQQRDFPVYNLTGSKMLSFISLMRQYPDKKFIFTGNQEEIKWTRYVLKEFNLDKDPNVILLGDAKTTADNAYKTFDDIKPSPEQKWVLVTSAFHMPRSVGLFRGAGWNIIPFPVDYHTNGKEERSSWLEALHAIAWRTAIKEWAGLVNNYLEGLSPSVLPEK